MQEGGGLFHCICVEYHVICLFVFLFLFFVVFFLGGGGGGGGLKCSLKNMPLKPASSWLIFTTNMLTSRVH